MMKGFFGALTKSSANSTFGAAMPSTWFQAGRPKRKGALALVKSERLACLPRRERSERSELCLSETLESSHDTPAAIGQSRCICLL